MTHLDELREILFEKERRELRELQSRIREPHRRARDIAESLPDSVSMSLAEGPELAQSLEGPVTDSIKQAAREHTQLFADALFPVMMPAIRRSIAETLRAFVQTLNQTLEQALSPKSIRWRLEAMRTGIPFHEVVLKHTLIYRVEQVFLIHRNSGLLIDHLSHPKIRGKDSDAISAMLTAIRDFVHDSFDSGASGELDSIDIGDHTTWLLHSPFVMLACVIRGIPPLELRDKLSRILEELDRRYAVELEQFNGDKANLGDINPILNKCLSLEVKDSKRRYSRFRALLRSSPAILLLLFIILGPILYWGGEQYTQKRYWNSLRKSIDDTPGLVVINISTQRDSRIFKVLRDPLAKDPLQLALALGYRRDEIDFDVSTYQSVEQPIVLKRARHMLRTPQGIELTLNGGILKASGSAPQIWIDKARDLGPFIAGVNQVDLDEISSDPVAPKPIIPSGNQVDLDEVSSDPAAPMPIIPSGNQVDLDEVGTDLDTFLHEALAKLQPPQEVSVSIGESELRVGGKAPWAWIQQLPQKLERLPWLRYVNVAGLSISKSPRLKRLVEQMSDKSIYFSQEIQIREDSLRGFPKTIADLKHIYELSRTEGFVTHIELVGYTDGTGGPELNYQLRDFRAREVLMQFVSAGLDTQLFAIIPNHQVSAPGFDASKRKVRIKLQITPMDIKPLFKRWLQ